MFQRASRRLGRLSPAGNPIRDVGTNEIMRRSTCVWRWQERFIEEGFDRPLRDRRVPRASSRWGRDGRAGCRANVGRTTRGKIGLYIDPPAHGGKTPRELHPRLAKPDLPSRG
jgi:hypothetical protein